MSQGKTNRAEHIKTVILVVLFFTTILLLYLLWSLDSQSRFHLPDILPQRQTLEAPEAESMLIPDQVVYGMGDGSYRQTEADTRVIFEKALLTLQTMFGESGAAVSEITEEQYQDAMGQYRSLAISFAYAIPFGELCGRWEIPQPSGAEVIQAMNALAFSEAAAQSIFIADLQDNKYYRLYAQSETDVFAGMTEGEDLSELTAYYTVGNILGGENDWLIPLTAQSSLVPLRWHEESEEASQNVQQALAEALFGENFDFVRRITDNFGNVTYMYGYGQKTFTHQVDGVLEYKNETLDETAGGFFRDLETALSFVAAHGTWDSIDGREIRFFLTDVQAVTAGRQEGYRFWFGSKIMEQPLFYESGTPIEIEVLDGQISYYRRDVISVLTGSESGAHRPVQDPANVIARNYNHIYNVMTGNLLSVNEESAFEYVAGAVREIRMGLVRIANDDWLQPAWILETSGGHVFYFSLYEAIPIGMNLHDQKPEIFIEPFETFKHGES